MPQKPFPSCCCGSPQCLSPISAALTISACSKYASPVSFCFQLVPTVVVMLFFYIEKLLLNLSKEFAPRINRPFKIVILWLCIVASPSSDWKMLSILKLCALESCSFSGAAKCHALHCIQNETFG